MNPILVVDDVYENVYMLSTLLQGNGYSVVHAHNGREALETAKNSPPSLIITDILMPTMDGFQLCKEWKADAVLASIPFIFYTATYTEPADEKYALSLGAERFLRKPMEPDLIIGHVKELLKCLESPTRSPHKPNPVSDTYADIVFRKLEKKVKELESAKNSLEQEIHQREVIAAQRRELETQLRHAQKMEAIGVLAGGLAHDFNNILHGITGCVEVLKARLKKNIVNDSPEQTLRLLNIILEAADKGSNLTKKMLTVSRTSEQEMTIQNPFRTVADALDLLKGSLPASISVHTNLNPYCTDILMDTSQIHQIVMNLGINASHAIEETGEITITLQNVELTPQQALDIPNIYPGLFVLLQVKDNGIGIPHDIQQQIFEPYFTTKSATQGTGLGLSVVKGIVNNHDAVLYLQSTVGKGSSFSIYFPAAASDEKQLLASMSASPNVPHSESVLLVNDDDMNMSVEQTNLESIGFTVTGICSIQEACRVFNRNPDGFDVVIYNQQTLDLSGVQLAKSLRFLRSDIPIIICTGTSTATLRLEAARHKIDLVLIKPISLHRYAAAIKKVLSARQIGSEAKA